MPVGPVDDRVLRIAVVYFTELDETQLAVWSPIILNGTGFGLMANHSLVMANYISRANAAINDMRQLLEKG